MIRWNEVAAADLRTIQFELPGRKIQQALDDEDPMLPACAAIGGNDGFVREDRRKFAVVVWNVVWPKQCTLAVERHRESIGDVRPRIVEEYIMDTQDMALAIEGNFGIMDLAALMRGPNKIFRPVFDPFHGAAQLHGGPRDKYLLGIEHHDLWTEAATDKGCHDPHLAFRESEHVRQTIPDDHRGLGRVPDGETCAARVPFGDDAAIFNCRCTAVLISEAAFDLERGGLARRGIIPLGLYDMRGNIGTDILVHQRGAALEGSFEIHYGCERFVFNLNIGKRIFRDVAARGQYHHDRLAGESDLVLRERKVGALVECNSLDRRGGDEQGAGLPIIAEVGRCVDRHDARTLPGLRHVDRMDPRMGIRTAHESHVEHEGQIDIVDVEGLARQEAWIFIALDALADILQSHLHSSVKATARQKAASPPLNFHGNAPRTRRLL